MSGGDLVLFAFIVGAVGTLLSWLVVRSAVLSALRAHERDEERRVLIAAETKRMNDAIEGRRQ